MSDSATGAAQPIQSDPKAQTTAQAPATEKKSEVVEAVSKADLLSALTERDKVWQSRFDTLLAEKKQEASKALTAEERIAAVEAERKKEKLDNARALAKAKHSIGDELDEAIAKYAASTPEDITAGAQAIRKAVDKELEALRTENAALKDQVKFGAKAPPSGDAAAKLSHDQQYVKILQEQGAQAAMAWHLANPVGSK